MAALILGAILAATHIFGIVRAIREDRELDRLAIVYQVDPEREGGKPKEGGEEKALPLHLPEK
jgi:hypothetical protein